MPASRVMRRRQLTLIGLVVFLTVCGYTGFRIPPPLKITLTNGPHARAGDRHEHEAYFASEDEVAQQRQEPLDKRPKAAPGSGSHPIWNLIADAERTFEEVRARQSKTLREAVAEYQRRYGFPPPPHFDKWYEFAKSNKVQLIDEFDMIHDMITPFWGLKPQTIRARAQEALGRPNFLMALLIRDHEITHVEGALDWQKEATSGMINKFIQYLPSMDLAFNVHDEPRVVVPHDDLSRLVDIAKNHNMPRLNAAKGLQNGFTENPKGLSAGRSTDDIKRTRFNVFPHQPVWSNSRMSCPADSPARALEDDERYDDASKYGVSELGFVYNVTAMSDICLSPSLADTYGFFDSPNAYNVAHDLFPIFSQSKISSYQDLVYPSPWYWAEKVEYDQGRDKPWREKEDRLYWRGSTTGGYSRMGGWRRHHRQNFVRKITSNGLAKIYVNEGDQRHPNWTVREVPRGEYRDAIDIHFSYIGQCDQGDCDAQIEFFPLEEHADQQDAWNYKHLLDMDGNAFSGRFYAFLRSHSLTFKYAIFREWHFDWLRPWVHYVPLSMRGDDWLEAVRFFSNDGPGSREAEKIAEAGREWAGKVLRKEDMEAWLFRLLLE
ncbi:hypothetical protein SODALDRAFT_329858 [Sodiomyces alkalinus F11]|uniref:Glycosyl transferase CAP10 domain-containing protein n=1 Tax=Sodiomyces alkalinus (strain CBS 110278 / VKM F-3762 / F11) TaxID=1314773 RepID=A0A3N2Q0A1_SODAK|nr:hypothetical protein SODALDRAFT_329858 [Sodiomyces alkalinus F11]ROT40183.1 hypothetical protein SODALDRAFT_329858 [Sodiomyces alkalinus F11]